MAQATGQAKRVLVIDDEVKLCLVVAEFLQARHHEVATASTSSEALQQLEQFSPTIVLLDLIMPGLSGFDLLKLIRSRMFPPRVIIITSTDTLEATQQAMQQGAEAYMCKPIDLNALDRLISGFWPAQSSR